MSALTIVSYDQVWGRNKAQRWLRSVCVRFFITNITQPDTSQDTIMSYMNPRFTYYQYCFVIMSNTSFNRFNTSTCLCLSQGRTWISNVVCCGLFYVQWVKLRWEVIVLYVMKVKFVDRRRLNFLFIIIYVTCFDM